MAMGGFRRGLFGFNREDVLAYIENLHKEAAERESRLTAQIKEKEKEAAEAGTALEDMKKALESAENQAADLRQRLADAEGTLAEQREQLKGKEQAAAFESQQEEIERLSQGIGRLYLTAQTNVESMLADAEQLTGQASKEAENRLHALSDCEEQLLELRRQMADAFRRYDAELDNMCASLREAKETVNRKEESIRAKSAGVRVVLKETGRSPLAVKAAEAKER